MPLAYVSTFVTGWFVRDVVLTWEEYKGLMGNLLAPEGPPAGETRLSQWLASNRAGRQAICLRGGTPLRKAVLRPQGGGQRRAPGSGRKERCLRHRVRV